MTLDQILYTVKHLKQRIEGIRDHNDQLKHQIKLNNQLAKDTKIQLKKLEKQLQKLKDASIKAN